MPDTTMDTVRNAVRALNDAILVAAREDGRWIVLGFAPAEPGSADRHLLNQHPVPLVTIDYAGAPPHHTTGVLG